MRPGEPRDPAEPGGPGGPVLESPCGPYGKISNNVQVGSLVVHSNMINSVGNLAFFDAKSCALHRCETDITASWHVNRRIYKITGAAG